MTTEQMKSEIQFKLACHYLKQMEKQGLITEFERLRAEEKLSIKIQPVISGISR